MFSHIQMLWHDSVAPGRDYIDGNLLFWERERNSYSLLGPRLFSPCVTCGNELIYCIAIKRIRISLLFEYIPLRVCYPQIDFLCLLAFPPAIPWLWVFLVSSLRQRTCQLHPLNKSGVHIRVSLCEYARSVCLSDCSRLKGEEENYKTKEPT